MRAFVALAVPVVLCSCSIFSHTSVNAAPTLDPSKIYLGSSRVLVTASDVSHYACVNGPVLCDQSGVSFDCRCP